MLGWCICTICCRVFDSSRIRSASVMLVCSCGAVQSLSKEAKICERSRELLFETFTCLHRTRIQSCSQHWPQCHLVLYYLEFDFKAKKIKYARATAPPQSPIHPMKAGLGGSRYLFIYFWNFLFLDLPFLVLWVLKWFLAALDLDYINLDLLDQLDLSLGPRYALLPIFLEHSELSSLKT